MTANTVCIIEIVIVTAENIFEEPGRSGEGSIFGKSIALNVMIGGKNVGITGIIIGTAEPELLLFRIP